MFKRRDFLRAALAAPALALIPRFARAAIYDYKILGGVVDPTRTWVNAYGDGAWHEVGDGNWRVSFTPTAPGRVLVMANLSKHRIGEGSGHSRLYSKARIALVSPVYKNDYASYQEAIFEGTPGYGDQIRFLDAPLMPFIVVDITEQAVGATHTFSCDQLAGDGLRAEVCYGAPMVIMG